MPFGKKEVPRRTHVDAQPTNEPQETLRVDFDSVYQDLFKPALDAAGLQPFRADDECAAGDILKDMFAELVTADFVLADISILNANVFYELGIRHMAGPRGVICLHAGWSERPFDVAPMRTFKYDGQLFKAGAERDDAWKMRLAAEVVRLGEVLRKAVDADRTTEGSPVYANLPSLVPPDAGQIETAKFKHYQAQAAEWNQRVTIAGREGRAEDILTLAGDAPSPYYRRKLLRQCGDALVTLGRFSQAEKVYAELLGELSGNGSADELRVKCQLALIANRLGRAREAERKLSDLARERPGDPEAQGSLGRVYKDMWRSAWEAGESPGERLALAWRNVAVARKALASYALAVRQDPGSYYNGINVVALASLIGHVARETGHPENAMISNLADIIAVVRLAASAKLEAESETVWARATLGELQLVIGDSPRALEEYEQAAADPSLTWFNIRSMCDQAQLFEKLSFQMGAVEAVLSLLEERLAELPHPSSTFEKIVVCSGHMIDGDGRKAERFPERKAEFIRERIAALLAKWDVGSGALAVCGGACGTDIIFAEECLARGATVRLLLAQEVPDFVLDSVHRAGPDWVRRFHALREKSQVATQPGRLGSAPHDVSIYARTNLWILNTARVEATDCSRIRALLVWDEKPTGDGPGGTSDFELRVRDLGGEIEIINPLLVS